MILAVKRGSASAHLVAPDAQGLYWVAGLDLDLPVHRSLEYLVEGFKPTGSSNCAIRVKGKKLAAFLRSDAVTILSLNSLPNKQA